MTIPASAIVYLDSNAIIEIIEGEARSFREFADLSEAKAVRSGTSELTYAEVLVGGLKDGASPLVEIYENLFSSSGPLEVIPVAKAILRESAVIQASLGNKCIDSIHVATARVLGCSLFVSADKRMKLPAGMTRVSVDEARNWMASR